jgi:hypothetical protein
MAKGLTRFSLAIRKLVCGKHISDIKPRQTRCREKILETVGINLKPLKNFFVSPQKL